ncbi:hypothetical protein [Bacillus pseudomycoides]|uniref:hypothetical protein n=1 Tax=Bacillus pseudomycoides TaxID=64104 RepID=UPI003CFAEB4C
MKNKKTKKIISSVLVGTFLFGVAAPLTFNAKEAKAAESGVEVEQLTPQEILELLELQRELQEHGITAEDIANGIQAELPEGSLPLETQQQAETLGIKSHAAKVAAKQMLKNLNRIGRVAWDRSVRQYVDKLPISWDNKKALKGYLSYTVVVKTLNIVIGFSGTITNAISTQLKKMGCPAWLADMAARAIVTLLF